MLKTRSSFIVIDGTASPGIMPMFPAAGQSVKSHWSGPAKCTLFFKLSGKPPPNNFYFYHNQSSISGLPYDATVWEVKIKKQGWGEDWTGNQPGLLYY